MSGPGGPHLRRLGAPDELCAWARETPHAEPPRPYRLWWQGAQGEQLDLLFAEERDAIATTVEALLGADELRGWLAQATERDADHETLAVQVAQRAQVVARGYREAPTENVLAGFAALAWLLRAIGAIATARARRVGQRDIRARELAALVGAGHSAFLRDSEGLRVDLQQPDSPVNSELAYAFSCIAEAWKELQRIGAVA